LDYLVSLGQSVLDVIAERQKYHWPMKTIWLDKNRELMRRVQKRRLGRTRLQVSVVGIGGIPIISASRDEGENVVRHAFEGGINYFDTA
jgi:hypothetical protein